ncbi:hypothetical protein [Caulobacter hibisci]|uniref:Uncharacterized protein n=1 Tax=Caulobacter hibisci TaxID=2035993 RepID=A0ABS0T0K3_9CAUL|nr:hypothetical protein [Caulobacter hibisci]MBI1684448.1 hypothetical protein [Caulobacter hibisci]
MENAPRRGRPKGAKNKRAGDLGAILTATHEGRTPGQQLAALCMPTAQDRREAKARARALGFKDVDLLAAVVKAENLAKALGWVDAGTGKPTMQGVRDAWAMMFKAYGELLPYVHQRLAPKEAEKPRDQVPLILMDPEPSGGAMLPSAFVESEEDQALIEVLPIELTRTNSHD